MKNWHNGDLATMARGVKGFSTGDRVVVVEARDKTSYVVVQRDDGGPKVRISRGYIKPR